MATWSIRNVTQSSGGLSIVMRDRLAVHLARVAPRCLPLTAGPGGDPLSTPTNSCWSARSMNRASMAPHDNSYASTGAALPADRRHRPAFRRLAPEEPICQS
jgi:hypothetical protein